MLRVNHFTRSEFACKCGCGFDTVDMELINLCNDVREFEGASVVVLSGCRCELHNAAIGGAKHSQHKLARAADLAVSDPWKTYQYVCNKYSNCYGFGLYDWGVHVDTRSGNPARWDYRTVKP